MDLPEQAEVRSRAVISDFAHEREELERVLRHAEISRSPSLVRFLTFICDRFFEGRSKEIREYTIAVEALGRREATFDSQVDPIVRVTARALRKRLREFYENEGKDDPLRIVLPLGHYVPQFLVPTERGKAVDLEAPSITVEPGLHATRANGFPAGVAESVSVISQPLARGVVRANWKIAYLALAVAGIFLVGLLLGRRSRDQPASQKSSTGAASFRWGEPVWSDEFDGGALEMPDRSKWTYDFGSQNSWGNHELETYCFPGRGVPQGCDPRHPNVFEDGVGHLVLRAVRNADGNWTSARITTRGLKTFQFGRIEARMKLPVGTGLWPAFWMLGTDFASVGWPASGAVDIVENVALTSRSNGLGPGMIRSSLHAPGYFGGNSLRRDFKLPNGERVDDGGFHTYGILWSPGMIQFYVDDPANIFFVRDVSDLPEGGEWVFDKPFYLVMNLAVGGDWAGDPDNTTPNSADILVDYVRVYKIPPASAPTIEWQPAPVLVGSVASSTIHLHGQKGTGRVTLACSTEPATAVCSLEASTVDFSESSEQEEVVSISGDAFTNRGKVVAAPGQYKLTITATTMSGNCSQVTQPFEVKSSK
jgi:beta-glucanase (GH16 family)